MSTDPRATTIRAERVRAEEMGELLVEAERAAKIGTYVWRPGRQTQWSPGMLRLLGLDDEAESVDANAFFAALHPADRPRVAAAWLETQRTGRVEEFFYRIERADGEVRWLKSHGVAKLRPDGTVDSIVGTLVDVTDLQRANERYASANDLLGELQRAAGVGTHTYDVGTGKVEWSDEMFRIAGVEPRDDIDAAFSQEITHPDDRPALLEWGREVATGRAMRPLVRRIVRPDGTVRRIETRARLVHRDGDHPRIVGVTLDVTQRLDLEEQVRHAAKMEAVGTLAAGVAHDFNNYLTVLQMHLGMLRRDVADSARAGLDLMEHALEQSAALTRQLLEFARKQPFAARRLDLRPIVQNVVALLRHATGPEIVIDVVTDDAPVLVDVDRSQLENALMNLLVNAREAMPRGGRVTIHVETLQSRNVREAGGGAPSSAMTASTSEAGNHGPTACIRVTDTGVGIPPHLLARIFEPYFSTKDASRGSGLGLASVYGIVKQHHGRIEVQSEPGAGSTFTVYLPRASESADSGAALVGRIGKLEGTRRVLLVEDMDLVRTAIASILQDAGHRVTQARDGREGLDAFGATGADFDVIVTDVLMPHVDGLTLARTVRERRGDIPIVFVTGYAEREAMTRSVTDHTKTLLKPFEPQALLDAIDELTQAQPSSTAPAGI